MLCECLDELLSRRRAVASRARRYKCRNVGRTCLDRRANVDGVAQVRLNSWITGGVGGIVENDRLYPNVLIEAALERSLVVHVVIGFDHNGRARRQPRVSGLKLQYPVVNFMGVWGIKIAKKMDYNGLMGGGLLAAKAEEQSRDQGGVRPVTAHASMIREPDDSRMNFGQLVSSHIRNCFANLLGSSAQGGKTSGRIIKLPGRIALRAHGSIHLSVQLFGAPRMR